MEESRIVRRSLCPDPRELPCQPCMAHVERKKEKCPYFAHCAIGIFVTAANPIISLIQSQCLYRRVPEGSLGKGEGGLAAVLFLSF